MHEGKECKEAGRSQEEEENKLCRLFAVPPDIIDRESSGDLTIREGQDVTLTCRAKGHPTPSIVWRREDSQDIVLDSDKAGEAD